LGILARIVSPAFTPRWMIVYYIKGEFLHDTLLY